MSAEPWQDPAALPHALVSVASIGIAFAFWAADRNSPTSRMLAIALAMMGVGMFLNVGWAYLYVWGSPISGVLAVPEAISILAYLQWLLLVRRTVPSRNLDVRGGDWSIRLGQMMACIYLVFSLAWPQVRRAEFLGATRLGGQAFVDSGFWIFAAPLMLSALSGAISAALLFRRNPDIAEKLRVLAFTAASPFFFAGFVLPLNAAAASVMIGLMVLLAGGVQYHVLQGQRGVFLSRFLSPQVAEIVNSKGLKGAMELAHVEITVVTCDLRGFTRYAQAHPSQRVIEVLSDYYAEVGRVVADFGGTIKDYAGDGILILVGAPIANPDHARIGLVMAAEIRRVGSKITQRWGDRKAKLGIGLGVASGFVTVGVIGSASRLEYTAVGSAVNLASRLCEEAEDQQILVAPRTVELAGETTLSSERAPRMKGFAKLDHIYALPL